MNTRGAIRDAERATCRNVCFAAGTQVIVGVEYSEEDCTCETVGVECEHWQYVTKSIEDIAVGDWVYSYDTITGTTVLSEVTSASVRESDHINYLTAVDENGGEQTIETTDTHPFWVVTDDPDLARAAREYADGFYHENIGVTENGYWAEAKDLRIGDVFLGANGELSTLVDFERVEIPDGITVYNFEVAGNHDYFIVAETYELGQTCILVHNGCPNPNGKKGCTDHQNLINQIAAALTNKGFRVVKEEQIFTPGGRKPYRVVDIAVYKDDRLVAVHQVGRTLKDKVTPVARERYALRDLRAVLKNMGVKRFFHGYN